MTTGLSRRLHNQAKPSLNARIQASERRLLRERNSPICIGAKRPRAKALVAHKEYKRSVRSRQAHVLVPNGINYSIILEKSVKV